MKFFGKKKIKKTNIYIFSYFILYIMPVIIDNKRQLFNYGSNVKKNWAYTKENYDIFKEIIPTKMPYGMHDSNVKSRPTPATHPMLKTAGNQINIAWNQYDLDKMRHRQEWNIPKKFNNNIT